MPNRNHHPASLETLALTQATLAVTQSQMQTDIKYIRDKIEFLYRIDPPGPLMLLTTHLNEHKQTKWRDRLILSSIAGASGTISSYIWTLFHGK